MRQDELKGEFIKCQENSIDFVELKVGYDALSLQILKSHHN